MKYTNQAWVNTLEDILELGDECAPRGMRIRECLGYQMRINMNDPLITVTKRKMNYRFAFGEAWWILSGSNRVDDITQFMKSYANYSDDGVTLSGAYGPRFADQVTWVADQIKADLDTRQAVINIWRDRPGPSKDVACTLSQQYLVRNGKLNAVATMRSNDLFWGTCYDIFTFSMMAKMVQTHLRLRGVEVALGELILNQGSAHIYERHWEQARDIISDPGPIEEDPVDIDWIENQVFDHPRYLLGKLIDCADQWK